MAIVLGLLVSAPAAVAAGPAQVPAKAQTTSLDSEAPEGAPPHWLPGETWVMQHWLPYDERRLYRLLGVGRRAVWQELRNDLRTLADLARRRGWEPRRLARELIAPWRGRLRDPGRLALLETRALRTLTQGHMAQHMFFHSLHQDAIPDAAARIFGVSGREEFASLRRSELSPVQICRLNGLSRAHAQTQATTTLRAMARRGVRGEAVPAAQARRLLRRQVRQVPRWLQQTRYNGPPPLKRPRGSISTASNYSNNAALSADGRRVVYEAYEAALPEAKQRGEIGVRARWDSDEPEPVGVPVAGALRRTPPVSAYNPALSADGRFVAFEASEGNLNFAKRYGLMEVFVRDLRDGSTRVVSPPRGSGRSRSSFNPALSGDGGVVAFEATQGPGGAVDVLLDDGGRDGLRRVPAPGGVAADLSEPRLSARGGHLAFTALARGARRVSEVWVRDLGTGRTRLASRAAGAAGARGDGDAYEPSLSGDGRHVAFTSSASNLGGGPARRARVYVRDLRTGATTLVAPLGEADGLARDSLALEPSLSHDGTQVAFVLRGPDRSERVFVRDLRTGATELVSRAGGVAGAPAQGSSGHPAISGDGRRVAFTSDAWNLDPAKCNGARGTFVRDLASDLTTLVSQGDGANRWAGPTKGSSTAADAFEALRCA